MQLNSGKFFVGLLASSLLLLSIGCAPSAKTKKETNPSASAAAAGHETENTSSTSADPHGAAPAKDAGHGVAAKDAGHAAPHWNYTGKQGQQRWGGLSAAYEACLDGSAQSPIDISNPTPSPLSKIDYKYRAAQVQVVNNGHTIQGNFGVDPATDGGGIVLEGQEYKLAQFHFHRPSEHSVNGRQFPMELHLVHKNKDGKLAVVGVLLDSGAQNNALAPVWEAMPTKEGGQQLIAGVFDPSTILPAVRTTFRYAGSLTTPPCSEGVSWLLMKTPVSVSPSQIQTFRALFDYNSRITQPLYGRDVFVDDSR
ncbi:MAG: carbonic anhydrase family protein [Dehalococcoidia bacterium]|nr:carbonic anhydrase family protein [Dehalococcoidia bacterium]